MIIRSCGRTCVPLLLLLLPLPAAAASGPACDARPRILDPRQGPTQVGEEARLEIGSPAFSGQAEPSEPAWRYEISHPGASYIAPRFSRVDLPPGARLIVRTPDGKRSRTYTGRGKGELGATGGFWGMHMPGDRAVIEIYSSGELPRDAVRLGGYAHGYPALPKWPAPPGPEAICGTDDSQEAKCSQASEPQIYDKSRAVARLMIQGVGACTGWLVGDSGHVMTNQHCIATAADAANTDYEMMAEGATCATDCSAFGACPGTIAADNGTLVKANAELDYALIQLPVNPTPTYGFLQLRETGAELEERIYIPGHPGAWGKRIADLSTDPSDASGRCEVFSLSEEPCSGGSGSDVGYLCDTQGGSSGSPVVGYGDHLVVALHHCAFCPNRGVPIQAVISDLGANLPPNALGTPCTRPPAPALTASAVPEGISLSWTPVAGAIEYRLYRSATPGGPYTLLTTTAGTSHVDDDIRCAKTYHYVVRAFDGCLSLPSNQESASSGACPHCAHESLYSNGFEEGSGLADWLVGSFVPGAAVDWRGIQTCAAASGSRIFRFGGNACNTNYVVNQFTNAQPQGGAGFAIPADSISARLSFAHRWDFETGFDGGTLMISVDGSTFAPIPGTALSGKSYTHSAIVDCQPPGADGLPLFSGLQDTFVNTEVDLDEACAAATGSGCAGHTVRVAFSTTSDCIVSDLGWYLDDVAVSACLPETPEESSFHTLTPCRLVDTRNANGPLGGPALQPGTERAFALAGACGIPPTAKALALNLTVIQPTTAGNLTLFPQGKALPVASTINFPAGRTRANNALLALGTGSALRVRTTGGPVHFVLDVTGYFE